MTTRVQPRKVARNPIDVHFAAFNDLDSVPTQAGWYAVFYVPDSWDQSCFQLYRQSKVTSTVSGIFNLNFEGRLRATGDNPAVGFASAENLEMLRSLFLAFAPPLYIGISNRLRARLKTHRKNVLDFMQLQDTTGGETNDASIEPDSERESRYFGGRIGHALRTLKLSPDLLYVKCVTTNNATQLKSIEKLLNFALTPHYGRK